MTPNKESVVLSALQLNSKLFSSIHAWFAADKSFIATGADQMNLSVCLAIETYESISIREISMPAVAILRWRYLFSMMDDRFGVNNTTQQPLTENKLVGRWLVGCDHTVYMEIRHTRRSSRRLIQLRLPSDIYKRSIMLMATFLCRRRKWDFGDFIRKSNFLFSHFLLRRQIE